MKNITILGATGSIGTSTLAVIDLHPNSFKVFAISANKSWQQMLKLCIKYQPEYAVMANENAASKLQKALTNDTKILSGAKSLNYIAAHKKTDYVMAAIVGVAGIHSVLMAAENGKRIMLANKESLILAGNILLESIIKNNSQLIPVDSEHCAIMQCIQNSKSKLQKVQLTASGGPFLNTPISKLKSVSIKDACNHPNWSMGHKISIDSATMINKGLEVIEAHYLFNLKPEQIEVVIHPKSIIHSLVYYKDGSVLSQLSNPDMRCAISYSMAYPNRIKSGVKTLDLIKHSPLEFYKPDYKKFPCLELAFESLKQGVSAIGAINAANEIAVAAFMQGKIKFLDIAKVIEKTLASTKRAELNNLASVIANNETARQVASLIIKQCSYN
jgi:1-deoxy-D-xylulose-5-phosphate reductoisomerase